MEPKDPTESTPNFMTKKAFSQMVEELVRTTKLSYIDSVVELCERENIDPEDVKKYLSDSIKEHIEAEAMGLNYLPKKNTLDI
jgi:hypothetical protein